MMEAFEQHRVAFVVVTQQFNTATSMGRLMLNVLLSFAQFEREIIAERTRDKMAATRRKGKWSAARRCWATTSTRLARRLVVNEDEAERVRAIFALVPGARGAAAGGAGTGAARLDQQALADHARDATRGGRPFTKTSSAPAADQRRVHRQGPLQGRGPRRRAAGHRRPRRLAAGAGAAAAQRPHGRCRVRNQFGALLKGLLRCVPCGCCHDAGAHDPQGQQDATATTSAASAQKRGWHTCPSKSIPAGEIERFVVEQIRGIGTDPALVRETLTRRAPGPTRNATALQAERRGLERDAGRWNDEIRGLLDEVAKGDSPTALQRLAELQERIRTAEQRAIGDP